MIIKYISLIILVILALGGSFGRAWTDTTKVETTNSVLAIEKLIISDSSIVDSLIRENGKNNEVMGKIEGVIDSLRKKNGDKVFDFTKEIAVLKSLEIYFKETTEGDILVGLKRVNRSLQDSINTKVGKLDTLISDLEHFNRGLINDIQNREKLISIFQESIGELKRIKEKDNTVSDSTKVQPFKVDAVLSLSPDSKEAGNFLTPTLSARYNSQLIPKSQLFYDVKLRIQPPVTLEDTSAIFNRILTSGADGLLQLGLGIKKGLKFKSDDSQSESLVVQILPWFGINWLKSTATSDTGHPIFSFLSGGGDLGLKAGPTAVGLQLEYHQITGDTLGSLASKLKRTLSINLLVALNTDKYELQFKYLVFSTRFKKSAWKFWDWGKREDQRRSNNQNLAIQAGISFFPFK